MRHEITVARLKELLAELNDTDKLIPNAVGNLIIQDADGKDLGFIDLLASNTSIERY